MLEVGVGAGMIGASRISISGTLDAAVGFPLGTDAGASVVGIGVNILAGPAKHFGASLRLARASAFSWMYRGCAQLMSKPKVQKMTYIINTVRVSHQKLLVNYNVGPLSLGFRLFLVSFCQFPHPIDNTHHGTNIVTRFFVTSSNSY